MYLDNLCKCLHVVLNIDLLHKTHKTTCYVRSCFHFALNVIECKVNHVRFLFYTNPIKLQIPTIFTYKLQHVTCTIFQCVNKVFPFHHAYHLHMPIIWQPFQIGYQASITHGCHYKSM